MEYKEISIVQLNELSKMYVDTFNSEPWNDKWTIEIAKKRLNQIINTTDFYGLSAYNEGNLWGMILGIMEQFYDGVIFNIKEFCIKNELRGKGLGSELLKELEIQAKEFGVIQIVLSTSKGDYTEHFYHNNGFESYNDLTLMGKKINC